MLQGKTKKRISHPLFCFNFEFKTFEPFRQNYQSLDEVKIRKIYQNSNATLANRESDAATC